MRMRPHCEAWSGLLVAASFGNGRKDLIITHRHRPFPNNHHALNGVRLAEATIGGHKETGGRKVIADPIGVPAEPARTRGLQKGNGLPAGVEGRYCL